MALYPQTTCFYKAVIHEPPSRVSKCLSELKESHLTYNLHSSDKMIGLPQVSETAVNFGLAQEKKIDIKKRRKENHLWTGDIEIFRGLICQPTDNHFMSICMCD